MRSGSSLDCSRDERNTKNVLLHIGTLHHTKIIYSVQSNENFKVGYGDNIRDIPQNINKSWFDLDCKTTFRSKSNANKSKQFCYKIYLMFTSLALCVHHW